MNPRILLGYAAPYVPALALALALMLLDTAVTLAIPWAAGHYAQEVLSDSRAGTGAILLLLLALFALQALLKFSTRYVTGRAETHILADLRVRIYDHLQALTLAFHQWQSQGNVLALLTNEVAQLSGFIAGTLLSVPALLVTIAGAIVLMARIDPLLAGLVALVVPVFHFTLKVLGRRLRPLSRQVQEAHAAAVAIAGENLEMLPAIKTFTREPHESGRYARQVDRMRLLGVRELRIHAAMEPALQFIAASAVVVLLWVGSQRIGQGQMSTAALVSLLLYAAVLTRPVGAMAGVYGQTQMARGTLERLQRVLTEKPERLGEGETLPPLQGDIEFRDVRFHYPGRPDTLAGLALHVRAGETVALTGRNGAGKSTLVHLLMRLHEPQSGGILLDGRDIAQASLHSLRSQVGVVPQHVLLFNGTVGDNIGYGVAGASQEAIVRAARIAQAHDFIMQLPQQYDTLIGDRGVRLSGGQRQRVALARALLKDPPILVLDEATAMFDPAGERSFIEGCHESLSRRTVILITHRPASLALADRIIHLEDGAATEAAVTARDLRCHGLPSM